MLKGKVSVKSIFRLVLPALIAGGLTIPVLFYAGLVFTSSLPREIILVFGAATFGSYFLLRVGANSLPRFTFKAMAFLIWGLVIFSAGAFAIQHYRPPRVRFIAGETDLAQFSQADYTQVSGLRVEIGNETRPCIGLHPNTNIRSVLEVGAGADLVYGAAIIRPPGDHGDYSLEVLLRDNDGNTQKLEEFKFPDSKPHWSDHRLDFSSLAGRKVEFIFQLRSSRDHAKSGEKPALGLVSNPRLIIADPGRPNIILIVVDTLRADQVSLDPSAPGLTPRLAQLAGQGVSFARHYSQSSWTIPSTASLLTGTMPIQTGALSLQRMRLGPHNQTAAEILAGAGWRTAAFSGNGLIHPNLGFDQGFDRFEIVMPLPLYCWRAGEKLTARAKTWIRRNRQLPFFLYLHYVDPHAPYFPPREYISFRGPNKISLTDFLQVLVWWGPFFIINAPRLELNDTYHTLYRGEVRYLDDCLGQLLDELKKEGLLDNTMIIIASDHGEEFREHGLLGHGTSLYDEVLRVPLIIYDGRNKPPRGKVITTTTSNLDLLPTLIEALGLPVRPALLGQSWFPLFQGQPVSPSETVFAELPELQAYDLFQGKFRKGLRESYFRAMLKGPIKIITATDPRQNAAVLEIYDRERDPREKNNLALTRRKEFESALEEMSAFFQGLPSAVPPREARTLPPEMVRHLKALGYLP